MLPQIKYYAIHYNSTQMLEWQFDSFYKHCQNPFQIIVVNNARDISLRSEINKKCNDLQLEAIQTYNDTPFSLAGRHHQIALNDIWQNYCIKDQCIVGILDGDVFPLKSFKIEDGDWSIIGAPQHRKEYEYLTPVVVFFNMYNLPSPEEIDFIGEETEENVHLDTGGGITKYFKKYPHIKEKVRLMRQTHHIKSSNNNLHVLPNQVRSTYNNKFEVELFDEKFLHFCRSSGWSPSDRPVMQQKEEWVKDFIYKCINNETSIHETRFNISNEFLGWANKDAYK